MELVVVVHVSEEQEAIAQSRCIGLTWMDIRIYIQMQSDNAAGLYVLFYSSAITVCTYSSKYVDGCVPVSHMCL